MLIRGKFIGHPNHLCQIKTSVEGVELEDVEELKTGMWLIGRNVGSDVHGIKGIHQVAHATRTVNSGNWSWNGGRQLVLL